ncbi:hypothetical protein C8R45DRAFT_945110 [Mycena sanguinolenta]|nr:hypothetical protein C8R45DRAFT_945110 [Mycena sanguinolenta]
MCARGKAAGLSERQGLRGKAEAGRDGAPMRNQPLFEASQGYGLKKIDTVPPTHPIIATLHPGVGTALMNILLSCFDSPAVQLPSGHEIRNRRDLLEREHSRLDAGRIVQSGERAVSTVSTVTAAVRQRLQRQCERVEAALLSGARLGPLAHKLQSIVHLLPVHAVQPREHAPCHRLPVINEDAADVPGFDAAVSSIRDSTGTTTTSSSANSYPQGKEHKRTTQRSQRILSPLQDISECTGSSSMARRRNEATSCKNPWARPRAPGDQLVRIRLPHSYTPTPCKPAAIFDIPRGRRSSGHDSKSENEAGWRWNGRRTERRRESQGRKEGRKQRREMAREEPKTQKMENDATGERRDETTPRHIAREDDCRFCPRLGFGSSLVCPDEGKMRTRARRGEPCEEAGKERAEATDKGERKKRHWKNKVHVDSGIESRDVAASHPRGETPACKAP